jgi:hypothetical protein
MFLHNAARILRQAKNGEAALRQSEKSCRVMLLGNLDVDHQLLPIEK